MARQASELIEAVGKELELWIESFKQPKAAGESLA